MPDLPPGGVVRCSTLTSVSQDAVDQGGLTDHSVVSASTRGGQVVSGTATDINYPTADKVGLAVDASVSGLVDASTPGLGVGDVVQLSVVVVDIGDLSVGDLKVSGDRIERVRCPRQTLGSRVAVTCDAELRITAADTGALTVPVVVRGSVPSGATVSGSDELVVTLPGSASTPAVVLDQRATGSVDRADDGLGAGDLVRYTYTVTNLGAQPVRVEAVTGQRTSEVRCPDVQIHAGSRIECSNEIEVTAADEQRGGLVTSAGVRVRTSTGAVADVVADTTTTPLLGNRDAPRYRVDDVAPASGSSGWGWWTGGVAALLVLLVAAGLVRRRRSRVRAAGAP